MRTMVSDAGSKVSGLPNTWVAMVLFAQVRRLIFSDLRRDELKKPLQERRVPKGGRTTDALHLPAPFLGARFGDRNTKRLRFHG